jgi:hypothetical protein
MCFQTKTGIFQRELIWEAFVKFMFNKALKWLKSACSQMQKKMAWYSQRLNNKKGETC